MMKERLAALKALRGKDLIHAERERQLNQSIEIMNHLLASSARPQSIHMLRRILQERAAAHVKWGRDQDSLPGLF